MCVAEPFANGMDGKQTWFSMRVTRGFLRYMRKHTGKIKVKGLFFHISVNDSKAFASSLFQGVSGKLIFVVPVWCFEPSVVVLVNL